MYRFKFRRSHCFPWRIIGKKLIHSKHQQKSHFIKRIVDQDVLINKLEGKTPIVTRFPPEPNGFLHLGHAKAICLNFDLAKEYDGLVHLRFDDTNPQTEEEKFISAIIEDIKWLGYSWDGPVQYSSGYFDRLYDFAKDLIRANLAYVCSLSPSKLKEYRGTLTKPGQNSPFRSRSVDENLKLFEAMKAGKFSEGEHMLRAKIDMSAGNMSLRDPVLYRICYTSHHQTHDKWCIYPLYDFAQCLCDALGQITHSLCTTEFITNRALYDWLLQNVDALTAQPKQIEYSRLGITNTVLSKRKLMHLVEGGYVNGWDDPRMPTLRGLRRRGYPPSAIRDFCRQISLSRGNNIVESAYLEHFVRNHWDTYSPRTFCVFEPLKVVLENYSSESSLEELNAPRHPKDPSMGVRTLPFSNEIYIERNDFSQVPPKKWRRLTLGGEVRLRYAYVIKCHQVVTDKRGEIKELRCTYDKETLGKKPKGRKVKGVIHWVDSQCCLPLQVYRYEPLFVDPNPDSINGPLELSINPRSVTTHTGDRKSVV